MSFNPSESKESTLSKFADMPVESWNIPYTISIDWANGPDITYKDGKYYVNGVQCAMVPTVDEKGTLKELNLIEVKNYGYSKS